MDFSRITKYLTLGRARVATAAEAAAAHRPFDKYYSIEQSRDIRLLPGSFIIPAHLEGFGLTEVAWIVYQYNYSVSNDFRITQLLSSPFENCIVCVRYREGEVATRYVIGGFNNEPDAYVPAEQYTNQVIKRNFVIEVWKRPLIVAAANITSDVTVLTSRLIVPSNVEQEESILLDGGDEGLFVQPELFVSLPEDIPTDYDDVGPWLDN